MAALSDYLKDKLLDHAVGKTSYTMPGTVKVCLYTSNPTAADVGTEVTGGSYTRQTLATAAASGGSAVTSGVITFSGLPDCTSTPITHVAVRDSGSGGNLLWFGPLAASKSPSAGDSVSIAAGDLVFTLS